MAIDESLIGEVRPNGSAVERLRKRNRIRPWESALVNESAKHPEGNPPSGQATHGVTAQEDRSPTGQSVPGVPQPPGESPQREPELQGSAPNRSLTQKRSSPPGDVSAQLSRHAPDSKSAESHSGPDEHRATQPGGAPSIGASTDGQVPTGSIAHRVDRPVGTEPTVQEHRSAPRGSPALGGEYPQGNLPSGQLPGAAATPAACGFDPSPFVPADRGNIAWREKGHGELRIPHRLYEYAHKVTSTRNELVVFDCLLRFSLGFHRSWCEAGYSFIAAWTGISDITNVKKSIRTLVTAGIIAKTKAHDSASNSGTIYELPVVKAYLEYLAQQRGPATSRSASGDPLGAAPTGQNAPRPVSPPAGGRGTPGPVGDSPPKKENPNQKSNKTPSRDWSVQLDEYLDHVKPASKRESEMFFLGKLLKEYSSQDLTLAVEYVRRFGVLGSREQCHSPLKYLGTAIEQVIPKAREYEGILRAEHAYVDRAGDDRAARQNEQSAETELYTAALRAFTAELSQEEQDRCLAEATRENSVMGYAPPLGVLRNLAAMKWFEARAQAGK